MISNKFQNRHPPARDECDAGQKGSAVKVSLDNNDARHVIRAYDKGIIRINDTEYQSSLVVSNETLIPDWPPATLAALTAEHIDTLLQLKPEIIILGTGDVHQFPAAALFAEVYRQRIGVEIMSTEAACRTYNILTAEERNVVAGLIIEP